MAKDPAVLFYTSDFLSGTYTMTNEQVGKYIRLLCLQHQKGMLSEKDMMKICESYDEDVFSKFEKGEQGYYNVRMLQESEKRKKYSESRGKNRKKQSYENHMNNICESYENHMENENENRNVNRNSNKEGVIGGDWELSKRTFLTGDGWKMQFMSNKGVDKESLESLMDDFIKDVELKEDYKDVKELRAHFTNLYNKFNRDKIKRGNTMDGWKRVLQDYATLD